MKRREFWKFLAAAPAAAVAPLVATARPEIPADAIHIKGAHVTLTNLHLDGGGIVIEAGSEAAIHGAYITNANVGLKYK